MAAALLMPASSRQETMQKLPPADAEACRQDAVAAFLKFNMVQQYWAIANGRDLANTNMVELRQSLWDTDDYLQNAESPLDKGTEIKENENTGNKLLQVTHGMDWIERLAGNFYELADGSKITVDEKKDNAGGFDITITFAAQKRLMFPRRERDLYMNINAVTLHYAPRLQYSFTDTPMRNNYKVTTKFTFDKSDYGIYIDRSGIAASFDPQDILKKDVLKYDTYMTYLPDKKLDLVKPPPSRRGWFNYALGSLVVGINRCRDAYRPA